MGLELILPYQQLPRACYAQLAPLSILQARHIAKHVQHARISHLHNAQLGAVKTLSVVSALVIIMVEMESDVPPVLTTLIPLIPIHLLFWIASASPATHVSTRKK